MVQVPPGATVAGAGVQVSAVFLKSPAFVPAMLMSLTLRVAPPPLVRVTTIAVEAVFTFVDGNVTGFGLSAARATALLARFATLRTRLLPESLTRRFAVVLGLAFACNAKPWGPLS